MRRNYISPEFEYSKVFGTFNMKERSSFFGSKMIEIEDSLELHNQGIIYYQNLQGEQLDIDIERSSTPIVYSVNNDKKINHTLVLDESQVESQKNNQAKYILSINLKTILENFLFSTLKQYRTFEGVRNPMCYSGDVGFSVKDYISKNIINRYRFTKIDLYIKYVDLKDQNIKRFENNWSDIPEDISITEFKLDRIQIDTEFDYSSMKVFFNQEKPSSQYSFSYYFKLFWGKV